MTAAEFRRMALAAILCPSAGAPWSALGVPAISVVLVAAEAERLLASEAPR